MPRPNRSIPRELLAVWLLFAVTASAVFVTYARLPAHELYNVTGSGLAGGASRALVFLNFPTALGAIAVVALAFERMPSRAWRGAAIASVVLCAAVFWPGVVNQDDLDARPVNAICAVGVALALAIMVAARGAAWKHSHRGDRVRIGIGVVLLLLSPPWIAAELGFFLNRAPLLGRIYLSGQYRPEQPGCRRSRPPSTTATTTA